MIISDDIEKSISQNSTSIRDKNSLTRNRGDHPHPDREPLQKPLQLMLYLRVKNGMFPSKQEQS